MVIGVVVEEEDAPVSPVAVVVGYCIPDAVTLGATVVVSGVVSGVVVGVVAGAVATSPIGASTGATGGVVVEGGVVVPAVVVDVVPVLPPVTSGPGGISIAFRLGFWVNLIPGLLGNPVTCWMGTILAPIPAPSAVPT